MIEIQTKQELSGHFQTSWSESLVIQKSDIQTFADLYEP